jgi:hypothetical protein
MPDLYTREQASEYLAQIFPADREWGIYQFPHGWICQPVLSQEQIAAGQGLGLTNLVIDAETGAVFQYPSWSTEMVAEDYTNTKQTGQRPKARQIYPRLWRVSFQRMRETPETIEYQVQVLSQASPPKESAEYLLTIDKQTRMYPPLGHPMAGEVLAWAEWKSRQTGAWPQEGTFEM